jgi:hypothetical protein
MQTNAILHISCICVQYNATCSVALFTHPSIFLLFLLARNWQMGGLFFFFIFCFPLPFPFPLLSHCFLSSASLSLKLCCLFLFFIFLSSPLFPLPFPFLFPLLSRCFLSSASLSLSLSLKAPPSSFSLSLSPLLLSWRFWTFSLSTLSSSCSSSSSPKALLSVSLLLCLLLLQMLSSSGEKSEVHCKVTPRTFCYLYGMLLCLCANGGALNGSSPMAPLWFAVTSLAHNRPTSLSSKTRLCTFSLFSFPLPISPVTPKELGEFTPHRRSLFLGEEKERLFWVLVE